MVSKYFSLTPNWHCNRKCDCCIVVKKIRNFGEGARFVQQPIWTPDLTLWAHDRISNILPFASCCILADLFPKRHFIFQFPIFAGRKIYLKLNIHFQILFNLRSWVIINIVDSDDTIYYRQNSEDCWDNETFGVKAEPCKI